MSSAYSHPGQTHPFGLKAPTGQIVPIWFPVAQVHGYGMAGADNPSQETVDRVAAKLQAFYDGLTEDEQAVVSALLAQAARGEPAPQA